MESLSRVFWFTLGSGLLVAWLAIVFAINEGSGTTNGELALAAAGVTLGLLAAAIARLLTGRN